MAYYLRRLLGVLATLLVVSLLVFSLLQLAPGDPATVVAGPDATPEQIAAVRANLGLDAPFLSRYGGWLGDALRGDLGTSYTLGQPVTDLIGQRLGSTLQLVIAAMLLMGVLSAAAGVVLATGRNGAVRAAVDYLTTLALSVPPFVSSIILIFAFAVIWQVLPSGGEASITADPGGALRFLVLPALALALPNAAVLARLLATDMRRSLQEEYVLTARAKGASRRRIVWRHALPASLNLYIVQLGINFGNLIGGALVVEAIFARAGIGGLLVDAVTTRDYPTAQAVLLLTVAAAILAQMVSEMVIARVDPRVKARAAR
ncbi:ABC transporter permease [Phytohabitans sp. ZYX-F-186]|uniref:ABC transporter permease n=1 Tax=Phytohabitans maris TaxID=3071409 RepID=A0ABU0ZCM7_9ACTN|nr:ABC transporter permease [Phytohabitans sp. ZYX-F-186]MDQ7903682.1 ABC transporter permease [Phytohabitans sp. ZYX-F-186]